MRLFYNFICARFTQVLGGEMFFQNGDNLDMCLLLVLDRLCVPKVLIFLLFDTFQCLILLEDVIPMLHAVTNSKWLRI